MRVNASNNLAAGRDNSTGIRCCSLPITPCTRGSVYIPVVREILSLGFVKGYISVGENIIVRLAAEERDINPDEEWFVAKIEEKPRKLEEAGVYAAVPFEKGDWIVLVRWYVFDPSKANGDGDRFYRKGRTQYIPCGSIVQGVRSEVKLPWVGRHYRLSRDLVDDIVEYGDLCV